MSPVDDHDCMRVARSAVQMTALSIKNWGAIEVAAPKIVVARKRMLSMWTATVRSRGRITLPKALLQHLGVEPGDEIEFELLPDGQTALTRGKPAKSTANGPVSKTAIESARRIMIRRRDALRELAK